MLRLFLCSVFFATPVYADTLADIRQELSVVYVEIQRLNRELSTTGAPQTNTSGNSVLERIDAIERELRRLTSETETLELRVERIVADGTNRIGDLEFRLCELEVSCNIETLEFGSTLGGERASLEPTPPAAASVAPQTSEQIDFDRAYQDLINQNYASAADAFSRFHQAYPNGPYTTDAYFFKGQAQAAQGLWAEAARAHLEAFSSAPNGPRAPQALLALGGALGELGQFNEACITLGELPLRFPNATQINTDAAEKMAEFACR